MFLDIKDKKFTDLNSGRIISIKDQFEDIVILDNNEKVSLSRILDKSFYDEYLDPKTFFNTMGAYDSMAEKIKNIPDSILESYKDDISDSFTKDSDNFYSGVNMNESALLPYDPEDEYRNLIEKASKMPGGESYKNVDNVVDRMLNRGNIDEDTNTLNKVVVDVDRKNEDPILMMFSGAKRNTNLRFSIDMDIKIPRVDFIEMMEDSYEKSIIDYLSNEFTNELIKNPSKIRSIIKDNIKSLVYKKDTKITDKLVKKPSKRTYVRKSNITTTNDVK